MSTLTKRQLAVLDIVSRGGTPTGEFITREMIKVYRLDTSPAGAHRTAASLVRHGLADRCMSTSRVHYVITAKGKAVLVNSKGTKRFLEMTGGRFEGTRPERSEKDRAALRAQTQALNSWMKGVLGG